MSAEGFEKLRERAEGFSSLKEQATKLVAEERRYRKEPFFGKMPDRMMDSTEVSAEAKVLFGILHSLSAEKRLSLRPVVPVSMRVLCRRTHLREDIVRSQLRELKQTGWIGISRPDFGSVNHYCLYESSLIDREAPKRLKEASRRIVRDREVQKRLSKSIRNPSS